VKEAIYGIKINAYLIVLIYFHKALTKLNKLANVNHLLFGITKVNNVNAVKIKD
jgi:hypothetical protein